MHDDLSYDTWAMMLEQADATLGASEAHGVVVGLICARVADNDAAIAALGADETDPDLRDGLETTRRRIAEALAEGELGVEPLLPSDERPAVQRSRALIEWCRGFMAGFHFHGRDMEASDHPEILAEALTDIGDLARASGTAGESDLSELVEYLRVAVQLIYDEIAE
jgi:hypothetical protein